jgi:hypothetical protein
MLGTIGCAVLSARVAWTDVGILIATTAGVIVTGFAVLVALFGPSWRHRRTRPFLSVQADPPGMGTAVDDGAVVMHLKLHNEASRETARDVEVLVTAYARDGQVLRVIAEEENLNFDNPFAEGDGRTTSTVPAGYSRRVSFAVIERSEQPDDRGRIHWGFLATVPSRQMRLSTMPDDLAYEAFVVVTGSNFDALTFRGVLKFEDGLEPETPGERPTLPTKSLVWSRGPERRHAAPPGVGFYTEPDTS